MASTQHWGCIVPRSMQGACVTSKRMEILDVGIVSGAWLALERNLIYDLNLKYEL